MRSFKKIAAMIMAVAMLCSFTAFAATVELADIADFTSATPIVDLNYTSDASQNTILAYAGTELAGANIVYIDQLAKNATIPDIALDAAGPYGTYTVVVGGTDVATAATDTFVYSDGTPKYDVTLAPAENGTVTYDAASLEDVREGSVINFKIVPYLGYELTSFMVGATDEVNSAKNGTYALEVSGDVTITPVFTAIAAEDTGDAYTYPETFDVAASGDEPESKLTFAQAIAKPEATITSMGMYVQVKNGEEWANFTTTGDEAYGPKFPAARWTADMKYGIRFFNFPAGTYKVWSYVDYSDGSSVSGAAVEFTVE